MRLEIVSSRRLTGGNLYGARAGVVLDVELDGIGPEHAIAAWQSEAAALTAGLGWDSDPIARPWRGGASLFFEAPLDALLRATEVNEVAWARACATLAGEPLEPLDGALNVFAQWFDAERDAPFTRLAAASARRGVTCLWDDDAVTLGVGAASATWPRSALPDPDTLDWATLGTMPFAMITGTNGKSTTVRLLAAIMAAAGKTVGFNCT
ncbi:MAG: Mur ligase, partial [Pseudomonadota bacterium]